MQAEYAQIGISSLIVLFCRIIWFDLLWRGITVSILRVACEYSRLWEFSTILPYSLYNGAATCWQDLVAFQDLKPKREQIKMESSPLFSLSSNYWHCAWPRLGGEGDAAIWRLRQYLCISLSQGLVIYCSITGNIMETWLWNVNLFCGCVWMHLNKKTGFVLLWLSSIFLNV